MKWNKTCIPDLQASENRCVGFDCVWGGFWQGDDLTSFWWLPWTLLYQAKKCKAHPTYCHLSSHFPLSQCWVSYRKVSKMPICFHLVGFSVDLWLVFSFCVGGISGPALHSPQFSAASQLVTCSKSSAVLDAVSASMKWRDWVGLMFCKILDLNQWYEPYCRILSRSYVGFYNILNL